MKPVTKHLIFVLLLQLATIFLATCAPLQNTDYSINSLDRCCNLMKDKRHFPESKKDIFVSRGWGAGGMPFSVLYMTPHSSKAPIQTEPIYRPATPLLAPRESKIVPQVRTTIKNRERPPASRRQYSVIPQLFVSYGWAPIGKK